MDEHQCSRLTATQAHLCTVNATCGLGLLQEGARVDQSFPKSQRKPSNPASVTTRVTNDHRKRLIDIHAAVLRRSA